MAVPYQPGYTIGNRYGFRYGPSSHVPATSDRYQVPDNYSYIPPDSSGNNKSASKQPTTMNTGASDSNNDDNLDANKASVKMSLDAAQMNVPHPSGRQVHHPYTSPMDALGFFSPIPIQSSPAIPKTGFGAEGTVSSRTGGVFKGGRSYDPITGYANQEYATPLAWRNYMLSDPFDNVFGDKNNQYEYARSNMVDSSFIGPNQNRYSVGPTTPVNMRGERISKSAPEFEFAMANSPTMKEGSMLDRDKVAKKIALDKGLGSGESFDDERYKVRPGGKESPTLRAIKGEDYVQGAAPAGSQYSSTGKFQLKTPGVDKAKKEAYGQAAKDSKSIFGGVIKGEQSGVYGDDNSISNKGTTKSTAVATSKGSYADDAQAAGSGGGGKQ
jgi:hypothetical protein